ncbi:MAG TPA: enoyl-CoA hydratase/isomerase family protein [Candidatus Poseidoniales archaeon]|nr:MAG TPA: enoyl-CoA hydratase/isomerase family protein [Candidatus Poseidoniales archaeon]HIH80977.1 enoyl-CoA hydratase/isomerase family protein [Candidatus Thalassarchaeaceae archaeon]|tara:strand:- start:2224 stop:3072 length:849 start_codon:yes stop_codon:yes gene_type:complete
MSTPPESAVLKIENVPVEDSSPAGGLISIWTINRPNKLNALNAEVNAAIKSACGWAESNDDVRVIVFTGSPPETPPEGKRPKPHSFVAGADISEFEGKSSVEIRPIFDDNVWEYVWNLSKPTIAMVDGFALGGGSEIALSCDLRIATARSNFGTPEINLGLIPGGGGTQRLCRLLGYGRAMEMVMSGEMINGDEAHRIGLVNHLVEPDQLNSKTMEIAHNLASKSPHTIRVAKAAVRAALENPFSTGILAERDLFCALFDTEDMAIGVKAFLNRDKAEWTGA